MVAPTPVGHGRAYTRTSQFVWSVTVLPPVVRLYSSGNAPLDRFATKTFVALAPKLKKGAKSPELKKSDKGTSSFAT